MLHATTDPLADARVYYDAGARLNAGMPLYATDAVNSIGLYLYPPLLAIVFRPLALLPFPVVATIWEALMIASLGLTIRRLGVREPVVLAIGWLALPTLWAVSIGQAEPMITLLLTIGTPAAIAIAGHLKLIPWVAAIYWIARRDVRALTRCVAWIAALALVQLLLEPQASLAYLQLTWLSPALDVRSISPFAIHPLLWAATVAVLVTLAVATARSRYGWPAAVALAVLAYPRLLVYQLMSLLAVLRESPQVPRDGTTQTVS